MDPSRNSVSSVSTLDFIIGSSENLPAPSTKDFVHVLYAIGEQLRADSVLEHVVGNRGVFSKSSEVWELRDGLKKYADTYSNRLRARKIYSSFLSGNVEEIIYLGYDGPKVVWFWLIRHGHRSAQRGVIECRELTVDSVADIFDYPRRTDGRYFDLYVLQALTEIIEAEMNERRRRLATLEQKATLISAMTNRYSHAASKHVNSDGIEG